MEPVGVNGKGPGREPGPWGASPLSTIALFGAAAIVAQVLLLRESLIVVAGNELFIALFFGCWFVGIGAGATVGAAWKVRDERLPFVVPAFLSLQVVLLPALMISLRGVRSRWGLPAWELLPFGPLLRVAAEHLCPFSFLTGLTFPMLCRLVATAERAGGRAIGWVYGIESLGSLVGGAAATFLLAAYCEPLTGAWILGSLTAVNLAWFSLRTGGRAGRNAAAVEAVLAVAFLSLAAAPIRPAIERWSAALRHRAYGEGFEWLAERYTPYQHLALARRGDEFCLLSNGQFIETFPDPYAIPQRVHLMMSQSREARRVLLIGGGATGALRSLLLYPGLHVDYVEIDPQMIEMLRPYLDEADRRALDDPRVRILHEDARRYIRRRLAETSSTPGPAYDAILCNTPDPSTAALNRFFTRDFFEEARGLLGRSGVFVTAISSGVNYFDRELLDYVGSVHEALVLTFGHVLATPGTRAFLFATAQDDLLTSDAERLIARFEARGVNEPSFSPLFFYTAYETDQLRLVNRTLRGSLGKVRPNTDFEPVTYLYHLRLWNQFSGGRGQSALAWIERFDWRWVPVAFVLLVIVGLALRPARAAYPVSLGALVLTGASGMVSSIVLLLLFQNFQGSLYRQVGLLVALFMAGLTAGSLLATRRGRDEKASLLIGAGGCAVAFSVFMGVLAAVSKGWTGALGDFLFSQAGFFYGAMIAAGVLTGVQFPLVGRLAAACGRDIGKAGGTLESLDHVGACLGAFLTGVVLIPVSGIAATFGLFGVLELLAGLVLLIAAWRTRAGE